MSVKQLESADFDLKLSVQCADAYCLSTGLGCAVSDLSGKVLHSVGVSCHACQICRLVHHDMSSCIQAHAYGMTAAERFGGKYIYFCPMGLTCFVSPILGQSGSSAKITVGPFLMVDKEDYIAYELEEKLRLSPEEISLLLPSLEQIPFIPPDKVNALSNLLFMSVSFMNNVSETNRMLDGRDADDMQGQITEYILELKRGDGALEYPYETERKMLSSIADSDKNTAQRLLNELLGHVMFSSGGDYSAMRVRIFELLVVISRAAIESGVSSEQCFRMTHSFYIFSQSAQNIDELSLRLAKVMNQLIDSVFPLNSAKNSDVIYKALQYMRQNYSQKITLDEVAAYIHLSSSYFSKIFKKEMGCNFNSYLNTIRIEKSKKLLLFDELSLVSIATMVGYEDQSYFSKVFKRLTGIPPHQFRKSNGRAMPSE